MQCQWRRRLSQRASGRWRHDWRCDARGRGGWALRAVYHWVNHCDIYRVQANFVATYYVALSCTCRNNVTAEKIGLLTEAYLFRPIAFETEQDEPWVKVIHVTRHLCCSTALLRERGGIQLSVHSRCCSQYLIVKGSGGSFQFYHVNGASCSWDCL